MNSIFGIFTTNSNLIRENTNGKFHNNFKYSIETYLDENILLKKTFRNKKYTQKLIEKNNIILIGKIRVYNKNELINQFNLKNQDSSSNELFLITLYLKLGKDFIKYLKGHWSVALWDKSKRELFLSRDDSIQTNLYYYWDKNLFIFSSNLRAILDIKYINKELNKQAIYSYSGIPNDNQTLYKNIFELTSSSFIQIGLNQTMKISNYESFNKIKKIEYDTTEQYINKFIKVYNFAIENCIKNYDNIASTLSSGLDSGSITTLASKILEEKQKKLYSYSFVSTYETESISKNRFSDETQGIKKILATLNNVESKILKNTNLSYVDAFNLNLDLLGQPLGTANIDNCLNMVSESKNDNMDILLIGQNGNFTISYQGDYGYYLNSLLKGFKFSEYFNNLFKEDKYLKNLYLQISNLNFIHHLIHKKHKKKIDKTSFINKNYLNLNKVSSNNPEKEFLVRLTIFKHHKHLIKNKYKWNEWGELLGIEIQDPTTNIDLVNFCYGIPENQYIDKYNEKLLIKNAMKDLMPKEILWAKKRGQQSADLIEKFKQQEEQIGDNLSMIFNSTLCKEYLDINGLENTFLNLNTSLDRKKLFENCYQLLRALHYGMFLLRLERNCV
ncbi:MAG: asparagine synthase-related protein [Halarcobacter sp.]